MLMLEQASLSPVISEMGCRAVFSKCPSDFIKGLKQNLLPMNKVLGCRL